MLQKGPYLQRCAKQKEELEKHSALITVSQHIILGPNKPCRTRAAKGV